MKILTPEEEAAHNRKTWEGGLLGGLGGLVVGGVGVYAASARFHAFRQLSVPFRAFLMTGTTTFSAVISADRYSRAFEKSRHADADYRNASEREQSALTSSQPLTTRVKNWMSAERYPIVFGSWVASMGTAFALVNRNKYLTGQQKLVQARVYAQVLTLAVLVASFALEGNDLREGKGRWETVQVVDPEDPEGKHIIEKRVHHEAYSGEDQWMDMIETQERKHKEKEEKTKERRGERAKEAGKSASKMASAPSKDRQKEEVHLNKDRKEGADKG